MFVGPLNSRKLKRLSVSFSFHRASDVSGGQNIVLPVGKFGTAGAVGASAP